jgi:dTDP-4-dehydrorhamnose reductase
MQIIGTGLTGLIGTRLTELLSRAYDFEFINLENGTNILDKSKVQKIISSSKAEVVIHMAAKTNVDGCEKDKKRDQQILEFQSRYEMENAWVSEQTAYAINVFGTQNIIEACKKTHKKIVYISTDFVFDGTKKHYSEEDIPNPINWYAKTKYKAEKLVLDSGLDYMIIRTAYPYRAYFEKNDFVRGLMDKLAKDETLQMVTDHIMVPTFIDDFVNALDVLIQRKESGIFHVVGSQSITPFNAALKIAIDFGYEQNLIQKTTRREYFAGKAPRPFCLNLKNDKISRLGVEMSSFDNGLKEIKNQRKKINL